MYTYLKEGKDPAIKRTFTPIFYLKIKDKAVYITKDWVYEVSSRIYASHITHQSERK